MRTPVDAGRSQALLPAIRGAVVLGSDLSLHVLGDGRRFRDTAGGADSGRGRERVHRRCDQGGDVEPLGAALGRRPRRRHDEDRLGGLRGRPGTASRSRRGREGGHEPALPDYRPLGSVVIIVIVTVDGPQEAVEGTFGDELYRLTWRSMRI